MAQPLMGLPLQSFKQSGSFPGAGGNDLSSWIFSQFCNASVFQGIMDTFQQMCHVIGLHPVDHQIFYKQLKTRLLSWKAQSLWSKLDKRSANSEYKKGTACNKTRALVIGGGPCGLRVAIEIALLGGKVVVVEKNEEFSRNNVLHLWPFLIHDLKALGAKTFCGKFCTGAIDHISIRALQCILLKVALLLGVEVHSGVTFEEFSEPPSDQTKDKIGWRAKVTPEEHPVSEFVFDVCISADGKRNTMTEFKRKEFRGKLAIAITANFINCGTKAETSIEENSRVASIFNQKFFKDLNRHAGIDLENIVYYKDETHYFVMTAKKHSLLCKGVLLQDYDDSERLLSKKNVNQQALLDYARQAANMSTQHQLANLEFAHNHYGQPDVAMFDLTSMFVAEHACRIVERQGYRLLVALVGDTLLEPFWTTGSGCARGFLGAFDAAWMIRSWSSGKMTPLEVIAERESIYQFLSQTTPENLNKNYLQYTIDPNTRYLNLRTQIYNPHQVASQYDGHEKEYLNEVVKQAAQSSNCHGKEATTRRTSERVTYVTEGEIEESECEQIKHNLSCILRPSTFSDSDSSSDEELHFSGEEASDEQPDLSWAELARRYSEQLSRTKLPTLSQKRTSSANSGSESETFEEASDTEFETDYNTDKENASEESDPFFGACKGFGMRQHGCREEFSNPLLNLSLKQNICLETKPLPTSVEIMRNRMAFFDAISQPVRIDASVFLGLAPPPPAEKTTCHDEKSIIESEKDDEKDEQNVNAEMIKESDDILKHHGPEDGIDARHKKRHAEKTAVIKKAKRRTKRRKKEEMGHVTANVETIKLLTMQDAVSVVAISSATSSDEHCDLEIPFASELPDASKKTAVSGVAESCSEVDAAREESDKRDEKQSIWRDQPFAEDGGSRSKFASENSQALQYSDPAEVGLSPYQEIACEEALTEDKKCLALESAALESDDSAEQIGRMSDIQDHTDRQDLNLSTEKSEPFEELEITKKNVLQNYNHHKTVDENLEFGYVVFEEECLIHSEGEKFNPYEKLICNGSCKEYSEIQSAVTDEKENDHLDGIVSHDGSEFDHDKQNSSMMAAKEEEAVQTWDESAENLEHFEYKQTLPIKTSKNCDNLDVQVSTCAVLRHQLRLNGIKVATEENTSAMNEIIGDPKNVENTRLPLNSMKVIDETGVQTRAYGALSIECPDRVTYSVTDNALTEDNYAEKLVKQLPSECDRQTDVNNLDSNLSISNHKEQKTLDPLSRINLLLESLSVKNVGIRNESEKNEIGQTHAFILQNSPFEGEDSKKSISNSQTTVENGIIDENSHCKSSHEIYKEMKSLRMTAQKFQKPCRNGLSSDSSNYTASVSSESVGIHHEPSHSMEHLPSPTDERLSYGRLVNSLRFDDGSAVDMLATSNFREDLISFQNIVGMNIDKIATLTHVQDSIQPKVVVGDYRQQGQSPPGVSRKTIGDSGSTASALSPNRIRDDKRKFFFEPPQPVRIAPCQIFKNIPFFKQFALAKEATGAVSVTSRESDSVFLQKETSNHGCGHTVLRAESKKEIESGSHVESFIESQTTSALSVVHGEALKKHKKVLPTVPSTQPPLQDLTTSDSRTAIASAALLLVSSSMLGKFNMQEQYAKIKNPVLKEDKTSTSAFTVMEEKPNGGGESAFDVSEPTVARPCFLWSELKSESLMLRSEIRHAQQSRVSQSDVASTEEISPSLPQKDSRFKYLHHLKSKSKDSDATVRKTDKKDKGKSLLAILMPSRNFDKKEKSKSQYEPISKHTDPVSMAVVREKTKSLPLEKKQHPSMMAQESKHLSSEKSKGKLKSKTGMIADKPTEAGHSIYKEIAGIMEGIKKTEKRNQDKINITDRIEAVAPPPAKSPHAVLLPTMADSEDFETESELENDRLSLHRFQSQMHLLSEEEVAKVKRMQQKNAQRKQHEKELKRFHESQEIQQQLEDVEMRQREIERLGVEIEKTLSREGNDKHCDEVSLVQQWFDIAYEHSVLLQHESELMVQARELELEDRQSQLEIQLRERIPLTESHKAESLAEEEQKILQELIEVVEQRNALVLLLEEDRVRQQQYSKNLERIMSKRGFQLSPISHMHLPQSLSSLQEHR